MRIIAGEWRGRHIDAPRGVTVRPTLERVREAWMSIVHSRLAGARVLDLYSGSGALGLEALSRGAEFADFVEANERSLRALRANIAALGASARCAVHRADAVRFLSGLRSHGSARVSYDVAFADPPYRMGLAAALASRWLAAPFADCFGVEHEAAATMPGEPDTRRYGDTCISFYTRLATSKGALTTSVTRDA